MPQNIYPAGHDARDERGVVVDDISVSYRHRLTDRWNRIAGGFTTEGDARLRIDNLRTTMRCPSGDWRNHFLVVINPSRPCR